MKVIDHVVAASLAQTGEIALRTKWIRTFPPKHIPPKHIPSGHSPPRQFPLFLHCVANSRFYHHHPPVTI